MKILHTADWHLGKRLDNLSRHSEQVAVLAEICAIADREDVDVVLIAGDVFDVFNPPNESIDLFYKTCKQLTNNGLRAVVVIAGNHDSPDRIESPDPLARECGIVFVGFPNTRVPLFLLPTGLRMTQHDAGFIELKLPRFDYPLRLLLAPYANEFRLKQYLGIDNPERNLRQILTQRWREIAQNYLDTEGGVNIAVAHLFVMQADGTPPDEPEDEKPINVGGAGAVFSACFPEGLQYVAMGHLHRQQEIDSSPCPIVYAGSPLAYSFSEENQDKYVMLITAQPAKPVDYQRIKLTENKKLLRGRFSEIGEALFWLAEHPDDLVQLTIVTDTYLNPQDLQRLREAHSGIVGIYPEIQNEHLQNGYSKNIDLDKDMNELFFDYFKYRKGQEPNEDLKNLFKEILAVETEN